MRKSKARGSVKEQNVDDVKTFKKCGCAPTQYRRSLQSALMIVQRKGEASDTV